MKKLNFKIVSIILIGLMLNSGLIGFAQENEKNNIIKQERQIDEFNEIDVGGAFTVYLKQGDRYSVTVETKAKIIDKVFTEVKKQTLYIYSKSLKNPGKLNVYLTFKDINSINVHGAATLKGQSVISAEELKIHASGASLVKLDLNVDTLNTDISGAADIKLTGKANTHVTSVSGAGELKAADLKTNITHAEASGAGDATINASEEVEMNTSGAASISNIGTTETIKTDKEDIIVTAEVDEIEKVRVKTSYHGDTTIVKIVGLKVEVIEKKDSVTVTFGNHKLIIDDNGNVKFKRTKKRKFNGHWAGIGIGINGYFNKYLNMSFPKEYEYMNLNISKSIVVNINVYEQNISFSKNQKFGMLTGIGLGINNYGFSKDVTLNSDSSEIIGYIARGINIRKSKLVITSINIPVLFEFQTNRYCNKNSFHVTAGMIFGLRIASHTKTYFDEQNKKYYLTRYNPQTDKYEDVLWADSPDHAKLKDHDDFYLNPFRFDATLRIGWGWINLFGTYSVSTLFKKDKGPELYPFSIGLTLAGW